MTSFISRVGLYLGPISCLFLSTMSSSFNPLSALTATELISQDACIVIGLAVWMIIWWMTEAVPMGITSLLPIIYLSLTGTQNIKKVRHGR